MFLRVKSHAWKLHHSTGRYLPERGQFASQEARLRSWMSELHRRSFEFFKGSSHRNDANRTVSDWIREYKIHRADKALEVRTPIEFFTKGGGFINAEMPRDSREVLSGIWIVGCRHNELA